MGKSLRLSGRILLRTCAAHRVVAATGAGVQNFESIVGTMPNDLRIRLIGLIVGTMFRVKPDSGTPLLIIFC